LGLSLAIDLDEIGFLVKWPKAQQASYEVAVKKASEYRQHAEECRQMAKGLKNEDQLAQLMEMAETWERLAKEREEQARKQTKAPRSKDQ